MYYRYEGVVKVDRSVRSIHYSLRVKPELVLGEKYYVCFSGHKAIPGVLTYIDKERGKVDIQCTRYDRKLELKITYSVFMDEIGRTPEEAVVNRVTW